MKLNAGLVTNNKDLYEEILQKFQDIGLYLYSNIDTLKGDEYSILIIDFDFFETSDVVQFYLSKIRKKIQTIPVILIINISRIKSINPNWFFDDFIIYPFRDYEFLIRIENLLYENEIDDNSVTIGHLKINFKEYIVYLNNEKLDLTYKEFEILRLLIQNKGTVFTRKEMLNKIWGIEYIGGTRTVDVHIRRLRSKLGDEFNSIIETVRNVGYKCK